MADFKVDASGKLEKYFAKIIAEKFPDLLILKILYVWRYKAKYYDGQLIAAQVFKLQPRERDIFGFDVRIEVDKAYWLEIDKEERYKTADHELRHLELDYEDIDEDSEEDEDNLAKADPNKRPVRLDKQGRVQFSITDHDIILNRFKLELLEYGLDDEENKIRVFLNTVYKKFKTKDT